MLTADAAQAQEMREREAALFDAIAHGDDTHRAWLKEAVEAHFAGQPVPKPRERQTRAEAIEEAENAVWDQVVASIKRAWPDNAKVFWSESPTELITDLINERNGAEAALPAGVRAGLEAAARAIMASSEWCEGLDRRIRSLSADDKAVSEIARKVMDTTGGKEGGE